MLEWVWLWVFFALPLPLLIAWLRRPAANVPSAALRLPYGGLALDQARGASPVPRLRSALAMLVWLALLTAAARPQWVGDIVDLPRSGRDLLLAVDTSGSMDTRDMALGGQAATRFDAVKAIAGDFIQRRIGDRIGLVLFGSQAFLMTPLTFDRNTVLTQLNESAVGLAGRETAIGDAIGLSIKRLHARPQNQRVLILLTDGVNNAGELDPHKATEVAASEHVRIYTIGIGAEAMRVDSFFGSQVVNPSADLDVGMLSEMAQKTGGRFYRARNTEELAQIYHVIDQLEPSAADSEHFRPVDELFYWPLALALLLAAAGAMAPRLRDARFTRARAT